MLLVRKIPIFSMPQAVAESSPFELTDSNRQVLALNDEDFNPHTWTELKEIISETIQQSVHESFLRMHRE